MTEENKITKLRPNIFEYLDYRQFLKAIYDFKKIESVGFSYRSFSRQAGLKSSNFFKLVIDGERNISNEAIQKFAKGLNLTRAETSFFETLVHFNQSKGLEEKNRCYERIAKTKSYHDIKKIEASQYSYFSKWYFVALRELVVLKGFREDPLWINRKLKINLSREELKKAIETLIELKLLKRNSDKTLSQTDEKLVTPPELNHLAVLNFHKEMIKKAAESLEGSVTKHRDVSALTISLNQDQFGKIQDRLNQFRREIHAMANEVKSPDAVYQVNLQLFNLSEVPW